MNDDWAMEIQKTNERTSERSVEEGGDIPRKVKLDFKMGRTIVSREGCVACPLRIESEVGFHKRLF